MVQQAKRVKNIAVTRPIIYGNIAYPLKDSERKPDTPPDHSHRWTIFVRDPTEAGDPSYFIKKVVFKLHDTYTNPSRTIEAPPFEVTETGWGEFEIAIRIFLAPVSGEKPLQIYHHLRLHPYNHLGVGGYGGAGGFGAAGAQAQRAMAAAASASASASADGNPQSSGAAAAAAAAAAGPIESVFYDEIVFNEPTEAMFEILTSKPGNLLQTKRTEGVPYAQQTENEELDRLSAALDTVYNQVQKAKDQIHSLESALKTAKEDQPATPSKS